MFRPMLGGMPCCVFCVYTLTCNISGASHTYPGTIFKAIRPIRQLFLIRRPCQRQERRPAQRRPPHQQTPRYSFPARLPQGTNTRSPFFRACQALSRPWTLRRCARCARTGACGSTAARCTRPPWRRWSAVLRTGPRARRTRPPGPAGAVSACPWATATAPCARGHRYGGRVERRAHGWHGDCLALQL